MAAREWPLVVFTLLGQAGVGMYLFLVLPLALFPGPSAASGPFRAMLFASSLAAAAGAFSFFHLGNPRNAPRTLSNLKTSWLSREILSELVFLGVAALILGLQWANRNGWAVPSWLYIFEGLAGAAFVFCMANVYRLESVPAWNRATTQGFFFLTVLMTGAVGAAAFSGFSTTAVRFFATAFPALGFVASLLFDPIFGIRRLRQNPDGGRSSSFLKTIFASRLGLLALAATTVFLSSAVLAFGAVLCAEALGRILFFFSFRKAGL